MKYIFLIVFFLHFFASLFAQTKGHHAALGETYFQKKAYLIAIPHLQKAIRQNKNDTQCIVQLAISYFYTRRLDKAHKCFTYLIKANLLKDSLKVYYFNTLKQQGSYSVAKKWGLAQKDSTIRKMVSYCDSAITWNKKTKPVKVENLKNLNTEYSESNPSLHKNGLYFVSNRETVLIEKKSGNDGLPYQSAYFSEYSKDSILQSPNPYNKFRNDEYHAGSAFFVEDTTLIYYTRVQKDRDNVLRSKLFLEDLNRKSDVPRKLFILNDSLYSFLHPCMDKDQKLFFFASKMPGGLGGSDIYVSIKINEIWSEPINLGPKINSADNEIFPFYDPDGRLFFSSDRPEGLGGFDIFVATQKKGDWVGLQNLKVPVNSSNDEMGFVIHKSLKRAFFCSNRPGGAGLEDLYQVKGKLFFLFDK